jgi:hypothetical protein
MIRQFVNDPEVIMARSASANRARKQRQVAASGADGKWQEETLSLIAVTDRGSLPLSLIAAPDDCRCSLNAAAASRARAPGFASGYAVASGDGYSDTSPHVFPDEPNVER